MHYYYCYFFHKALLIAFWPLGGRARGSMHNMIILSLHKADNVNVLEKENSCLFAQQSDPNPSPNPVSNVGLTFYSAIA